MAHVSTERTKSLLDLIPDLLIVYALASSEGCPGGIDVGPGPCEILEIVRVKAHTKNRCRDRVLDRLEMPAATRAFNIASIFGCNSIFTYPILKSKFDDITTRYELRHIAVPQLPRFPRGFPLFGATRAHPGGYKRADP